jgi:hypothetical protein
MDAPDRVGSLRATIDRLEELERSIHPTLNTYRWWRPDMALPAVWNWLTPSDLRTDGVPVCRTVDTLRVNVIVGVDPTAVPGEGDLLELEEYVDLAVPILGRELYSRFPFGQRMGRRRGAQTVADVLGGAPILTVEMPIEVELHVDLTTPAPGGTP